MNPHISAGRHARSYFKMTILAVIALACSCQVAFAYINGGADGGTAGSFLYAGGADARSTGLGNASSADSVGAAGAYFNPACITTIKNTEFSFYYVSPMEDVAYDVMSFAIPVIDYGILAFSRVDLSVNNVEKISSDGIKDSSFSDSQDGYLLSYAYSFNGMLSLGLSGKVVTRSFDTQTASGFGIDLGALVNLGAYTASISFQNVLSPSIAIGDTAESYPLNLRFGNAFRLFDSRVSVMADLFFVNILSDGREYQDNAGRVLFRPSAGVEFRPFDFAAVRAGINPDGFAAGAGITAANFTIDYAAFFGEAGLTHNFGITARFGLIPTEREKNLEAEKDRLEAQREQLTGAITSLSYDQLYQTALNDYISGNYDTAMVKIKALLSKKTGDQKVITLEKDVQIALSRKDAAAAYDQAVALLVKGDRDNGGEMLKSAEKTFPGITEAKIRESMEKYDRYVDTRDYDSARQCLINVLAVDKNNQRAAEKLERIQELIDLIKKSRGK